MSSDLEYEEKKKSGVVAAILNLCFPGFGYLYAHHWFSAIAAWGMIILFLNFTPLFIGGLIMLITLDGFWAASRYNKSVLKDIRNREERATKECPYCAEKVKKKAKVCKHCSKSLNSG